MAYQPCFTDPRTRRRCQKALGFVAACFSSKRSRPAAQSWLAKSFGQQQNPLSRWLRINLLRVDNEIYNPEAGICKTYRKDQSGMLYLRACLAGEFSGTRIEWGRTQRLQEEQENFHLEAVVWCREAFQKELQDLRFEYQDKSHRLWHPLQFVKKPVKVSIQVDSGLRNHYDIESAALTLLLQHSQQIPLELTDQGDYLRGPMDLWLFGLQDYLANKDIRRQQWARDLDISVRQLKEIITALVAGAKVSERRESAVFGMLHHDHARLIALKEHTEITRFRNDLREMWNYLKWVMPRRRVDTRRGSRWQAISARDKWNLYFRLERSVLNQVRVYLERHQNPCFLEHDGWATRDPIDVRDLENHILMTTGFRVKIDEMLF